MKKKKGFTLIEIIAVIAVIAMLTTIAVPSVINVSNKVKEEMYCSKVVDIIEAAKLYEKDYQDEIDGGYVTISVHDLVEYNYLKKEDKSCTNDCVKDPRNNSSMDDIQILLAQSGKKYGLKILDDDSSNICKISNAKSSDYLEFINVNFDPTGGEVSPDHKSVVFGLVYGDLPTPTRENFGFEGWYTQKEGGNKIESTTLVSVTSDHTLYAHWSQNSVNVTYNPNGGTLDENPYVRPVVINSEYGEMPTPIRANYDFEGWYTTADGGTKVEPTTIVTRTENHTLYAHWSLSVINVTYDPNEGILSENPYVRSVTINTEYGEMPTPTKSNYKFEGWYTEKDGGTKVESTTIVTRTEDHTLYAHWSENGINVSFDPNGGEIDARDSVIKTVHSSNIDDDGNRIGNYANNLNNISNPDVIEFDSNIKTFDIEITYGTEKSTYNDIIYDFVCIYEEGVERDSDCSRSISGKLAGRGSSETSPKETKKYTINGNKAYIVFITDSMVNRYYGYYAKAIANPLSTKEVKLNLPYGEMPIPNKDFADFIGWYTEKDGGTKVESTTIVTRAEDHTLYAHWYSDTAIFDIGNVVNSKMKSLASGSDTTYDKSNTTITSFKRSTTIPSTYKNDAYKISIESSPAPIYIWYDLGTIYWYSEATKVYLNPDSSNLFYKLEGLSTLELFNLNTSNVTTMAGMFHNVKNLTSINLSSFDTSKVTDMRGMFSGMRKLESLDISNFNTSSLEKVSDYIEIDEYPYDSSVYGSMFENLVNLTSLNLGNFNTSKITNMSHLFYNCAKLTSLNVSTFDTSQVTTMRDMFAVMESLTSLNLYNFNTSNVTDMSGMFAATQKLETLNVDSFNTSNVTNMSAMFGGNNQHVNNVMKNLNVKHFDTSKVVNMSDMFAYLRAIENIDVSTFDTSKVTNMTGMFDSMGSLKSLDIRNFDTRNVTSMNSGGTYSSGAYWDGTHIFGNLTSVTEIRFGNNFSTSKLTNFSGMFENAMKLETVDLSLFDTSNAIDMSGMFWNATGIRYLDLSKFNTSKVTDMGAMFFGTSITNLDLRSFDTSNVTRMCDMFGGMTNLTTLNISSFNTSKVTDMQAMFREARSIKVLDLSNFDTSNVTRMGYYDRTNHWGGIFRDCTSLTTIYVSDKWSVDKVGDDDYNIFLNCYSLKGGAGTKYDSNHVDKDYARIDGGPSAPGYLTRK